MRAHMKRARAAFPNARTTSPSYATRARRLRPPSRRAPSRRAQMRAHLPHCADGHTPARVPRALRAPLRSARAPPHTASARPSASDARSRTPRELYRSAHLHFAHVRRARKARAYIPTLHNKDQNIAECWCSNGCSQIN